jgi:ATP-binding cassette subfamily B protein
MHYSAGFLALMWGAWQLLHGKLSFGSLTAVIQLVNQIQSPVVDLSGLIPKYLDMTASGERLQELDRIQGQPEPTVEDPQGLYRSMDAIGAEELSFSYDRDRVLEGASFRVPKGSFAVVTGPSGIGKSTLLKLLLGIFTPEEGELALCVGVEKVALTRAERPLFSYVPQGNLLLSGSIRDNLTIVRPNATVEEIDHALRVSCAAEFISQLPLGLDTPMGESGAGLSEGQGQRLAIARAVLGGAPVLLLDECTSALDAETERRVLENLRALPGRTCIAVTHHPAAVEVASLRLHIDEGRITLV